MNFSLFGVDFNRTLIRFFTFFLLCMGINASAQAKTLLSENGVTVYSENAAEWIDIYNVESLLSTTKPATSRYPLVDQQVTQLDDRQRYKRVLSRAKNVQQLEDDSKIEIVFYPVFETLTFHKLQVHRNGKVIDLLNKKNIKLLNNEYELDQGMVNGSATALVLLPSTRIGDVIDYSYTISGQNPALGKKLTTYLMAGWTRPVEVARIRVLEPKGRKYYFQADKVSIDPVVHAHALGNIHEWTLNQTEDIYYEDHYPADYLVFPEISVTEYENWGTVVEDLLPLYQDTALPKSLMPIKKALTALPTDEEKILQALRHAQEDIRYLGIEIGVNAYQPHSIQDIWNKRAGDCKDKTQLLIALLKSVGIKAYPALVNTRTQNAVASYLPSSRSFNHVITYVEWEGKSIWLDPTMNTQYGALDDMGYYSYGQALLLKKGEQNLTEMPAEMPENNTFHLTEIFHIVDYDAPVHLEVISEYYGKQAERMRARLSQQSIQKMQRGYEDYYEKAFSDIVNRIPLSVEDDKENNRIRVKEQYWLESVFTPEENGRLGFNFNASTLTDFMPKLETKRRSAPFYMGQPIQVQQKIILSLPEYFYLNEPYPAFIEKNDGFTFKMHEEILNKTLVLDFNYTHHQKSIRVDQYDHVYTQMKSIRNEAYQYRSFMPDEELRDPYVVSTLKEVLQ